MLSTTTIPRTFEQYAELHNLPADDGSLDRWREVYKHELYVEAHLPAVIPPCPSWCSEPVGHGYTATDGYGDDMTFERFHAAAAGAIRVDAMEHNRGGVVTVDPPSVHLDERDELDARRCREMAADLLAAADLIDRAGDHGVSA